MGTNRAADGFALPTILISAVILLSVLVAAVGATVAIRTAIRDARYVDLASLAAEAGETFAKACLTSNSNQVSWTEEKPLKPNTDCNGDIVASASSCVIEQDEYRTYFVVPMPVGSSIEAEGYVEALRSSSGDVWRLWSSNTASALSASDSLPVGTSLDGYWTSPPPGYLLEDGACVSQAIYADLYSVIGNTFGSCSSGQFKLPDSRGRVLVGKSTDAEFNTLGKVGGAKTHTLTIDEMPEHTHALTVMYTVSGGSGRLSNSPHYYSFNTASRTTSAVGGNVPHNNLQPYITATRVIKY